jgi:hypothetical protein
VWHVALAARVSKYGVSFDDALWRIPLAVLNQLVIYDELAAGRQPRWATTGESEEADLDAILAGAMTPS